MTTPDVIGGRYKLGETLGLGGMSEVRSAEDLVLGRTVAMKIMRSDLARDESFYQRFRREAQNAAKLSHPAIVSVHDSGEATTPDGPVPFIVMEKVHGQTVREMLRRNGSLPPRRAITIMRDVCDALQFSHDAGIVHRDVKPANIMLTDNGQVKVMDFGIARVISETTGSLTQTAAVLGTAQYLSPEQARGERVDARSDVYSAGCVLYEMLTGQPPFVGDSPVAVAYQHVKESPRPPSTLQKGISPGLDAVVLHALSKNPDNRYPTAADMEADLVSVLHGRRPQAPLLLTEQELAALDETEAMEARDAEDAHAARAAREATLARRRRGRYAGPAALGAAAAVPAAAAAVPAAAAGAAPTHLHGEGPATGASVGYGAPGAPGGPSVQGGLGTGVQGSVPGQYGSDQPTVVGGNHGGGAASSGAAVGAYPYGYDGAGDPGALPPQRRKRRWPWILAIVVVLGVGLGVGAVNFFPDLRDRVGSSPSVESIEVPDVVGAEERVATERLRSVGLVPAVSTEASRDVPEGKVIRTQPGAGVVTNAGTRVELVVSSGPEAIEVPNLSGMTQDQARKALSDVGLELDSSVQRTPSSESDRDKVVSQSVPEGAKITPDRSVQITLGDGPEEVRIPSVTGLDRDKGQQLLSEAGFTVSVEEADSEQPAGQILSMTPEGSATKGSTVSITVSRGNLKQMPNLKNQTEAQARETLRGAGFTGPIEVHESTTPDLRIIGKVTRQEPGTGVQRTDVKVTLYVARLGL